jgi:NAD(P)H dehydrogenase (quinone)
MIVVTGATGQLGQHVIHRLLKRVQGAQVIAAVRRPEKAKDLTALGVQVREADYSRPETLLSAFAGAEKMLLISSSEFGQLVTQHEAVVDAAKRVGVKMLAYTSILRADSSTLALAPEHKATEKYVRTCGLPFVFLRNGWYLENHTEALKPAIQHGAILGAAGNGRFASATRSDYAAAAVAVLTGSGHESKVYELAGDVPYTLSELAAEVSKQAGKPIAYRNLQREEYADALVSFGLPAPLASLLADADLGAARGELNSSSHDLRSLIGRPTVTLAEAISFADAQDGLV